MESTASFMAEQAALVARAHEARIAAEQGEAPKAPDEEMNGELFEEEQKAEPQPEMAELHGIADEASNADPDAEQEPAEEAAAAPAEAESVDSEPTEG